MNNNLLLPPSDELPEKKAIEWRELATQLFVFSYAIYLTFFSNPEIFSLIRKTIDYKIVLLVQISILIILKFISIFSLKNKYNYFILSPIIIIFVSIFFSIIITEAFITTYQWYFCLFCIIPYCFILCIQYDEKGRMNDPAHGKVKPVHGKNEPAHRNIDTVHKNIKAFDFTSLLIVSITIFIIPNTTLIPKKSWPSTEASITSSDFQTHTVGKTANRKHIAVEYLFTVNGEEFSGSGKMLDKSYWFNKKKWVSDPKEKKLLTDYQSGNTVKIYYHPLFPGQSSLENETGFTAWLKKMWVVLFIMD
ncbi:DUF3592 domain-containing protein [Desulfamplus magnetovallimortis]|nr:DUF3592 domain-containing protein [Desulfamplus magnetovallimortis]